VLQDDEPLANAALAGSASSARTAIAVATIRFIFFKASQCVWCVVDLPRTNAPTLKAGPVRPTPTVP
jgi:hypothetical protein